MDKSSRRYFLRQVVGAAGSTAVSSLIAGSHAHAQEPRDTLRLIEGGKSMAQIVLPSHPGSVEQHAAEELQKYLEQMSGAKLPIHDVTAEDRPNICIGAAAPRTGLDLSETLLGHDGYVVKTAGKDILLAGRKSYSCLYAVYHLLERHLGCGFFEDGDQVPQRATVQVAGLNDVCKPRFEWRAQVNCMQDADSGIRWWDWEDLKFWADLLAKKRLNIWTTERLADSCGIVALAAAKLGVPIELTAWQRKRLAVLRRTFDYARELGIRMVYLPGLYNVAKEEGPGDYAYPDQLQGEEFFRRFGEKTGDQVPLIPYEWCGTTYYIADPGHPATQKFVTAVTQVYGEALGTDHLYKLEMPSEGGWKSEDLEEMNRITYSMVLKMIAAVKAGDPSGTIFVLAPYAYGKTFEAQKRAVRDAGLPVNGDFWLNQPGRLHDFLMCDYYWDLPFTTGMTLTCGSSTNPYGDLCLVIRNAQELATDPRAEKCFGFGVRTEVNRCIVIMMDLIYELAWNPADVKLEDYLRRWTVRRYGPDLAPSLQPATEAIACSLLSFYNSDLDNRPLYRSWNPSYLPGLTPVSAKRTLSYLPKLHAALETLVAQHDALQQSMLYRYDLVDYGRTYLGAVFNEKLARAREALRAKDKITFEKNAKAIEEIMHFMARYCSAHPRLRLKTYDDWASRWPEILPGYDNKESNWISFTARISPKHWQFLLDYAAEDLAEVIEHYYWPRVRLYIEKMREYVNAGKDISGRLVERNNGRDLLYRVSDWAPPQGNLPWSAYGDTCEPELTAGDYELVYKIIQAGTVSGKYDFYEGPMDKLVRDLLDRYPVPEDLSKILGEPEPEVQATQARVLQGKRGDVIMGFRTPGIVEKVRVPRELGYFVTVEQLSKNYNLMRGDIASFRVEVSDYLKLTRLSDERASVGDQHVAVFEFEAKGRKYLLRYDPGSSSSPAGLYIDLR